MPPVSRSLFRVAALSFVVITICVLGFFYRRNGMQYGLRDALHPQIPFTEASFSQEEDSAFENLSLTENKCRATFPDLLAHIDAMVAKGEFRFERSTADYQGLVQGRVRNGQLHILTIAPDSTSMILAQRSAILQQVHRALLTNPAGERIPDIEFAFVVNDNPKNNSWSFARPNQKHTSYNSWLMPHFGFWSWNEWAGTMDEVLRRIRSVEAEYKEGGSEWEFKVAGGGWEKKVSQLVWRGSSQFNPIGNPMLRGRLLAATKDKGWADVEKLVVEQGKALNSIPIHDFCRYRYIAYTEGVTYSGRLAYHQACASVLITPPLNWLTSTTSVMRPIHAHDLLSSEDSSSASIIEPSLETVSDYRDANAIYIDPDFSNLEATIMFLEENPKIAKTIAMNQRKIVERGYLSGAAETCYWRALIRGWAQVAVSVDEGEGAWGADMGERFEKWVVNEGIKKSGNDMTLGKIPGR